MKTSFKKVTDKAYLSLVGNYTNQKKQEKESFKYTNYIYNAVLRYVETGDCEHLNNLVKAAKYTRRVMYTAKITARFYAHKVGADKLVAQGTTADKDKLKKLRVALSKNTNPDDKGSLIYLFTKAVKAADKQQEEKAAKEFNLEGAMRRLLEKTMKETTLSPEYIKALFEKTLTETEHQRVKHVEVEKVEEAVLDKAVG